MTNEYSVTEQNEIQVLRLEIEQLRHECSIERKQRDKYEGMVVRLIGIIEKLLAL